MTYKNRLTRTSSFHEARGKVPFRLCNDYLFRSLMQIDENALKDLILSVIRLSDDQVITSVEILNPIELGAAINEKDFILDILVKLNDTFVVNVEMQIANEDDWPERSLSYLCRTFDHLNKGELYRDVKTAIQISFLDYSLFPENPSFYTSYRMTEATTGFVYSDKFQLYVVCLNEVGLASQTDKICGLERWARFFRAKTWEELQMTVKDNAVLEEAAEHLHKLTQEEKIWYQCEARERQLRFERSKNETRKELERDLSAKLRQIEEKDQQIEQKDQQLEQKDQQLEQKDQQLEQKDQQLEQKDQQLEQKDQQIRQLTAELELLKAGMK